MVQTPSQMVPIGSEAPDFSLVEPRSGATVSRDDFADARGLLVIFLCNHCPFVKHLRGALAHFAREYQGKGLAIVGISANDPEAYPEDAPDAIAREADAAGYEFPYLFDESQSVAKAYQAACTPDFFLYDGERRLFYRGQFDGSRPSNDVPVTGRDLREAADRVLKSADPPEEQVPSVGCNIKWKPGNEPEWFG